MTNLNTPVIVGVGQVEQRITNLEDAVEPLQMMIDACAAAAAETGCADLLGKVQSVRVVRGAWPYKNPAAVIGEHFGANRPQTVGTPFGGNLVQSAVNHTAGDILNGAMDLVLITGAENGHSRAKALKAGIKLAITKTSGEYDLMLGKEKPMFNDDEMARNVQMPIQIYPMFENAIRYARGESIEEHIQRISELWSRFNDVAQTNPHAWIKEDIDAKTIRTPSPANRMISFPYPKYLNSNSAVDMGAALIMCSVKKARELGIPEALWVYPWSGTDANDHYFVSNRDNLHSSPAIRIAGSRALELVGSSVDELDYIDIYSCFPSAVQVAATELGISQDKPLTITGGLTFGGGPLNNYVMHSIARLVELLRENPDSKGLITANGGNLTKHAFGVYSAQPPTQDFQYQNVQAEVDKTPRRDSVRDHKGEVTIETYTVMYDASGPSIGNLACLLPDGKRTWANTSDKALLEAMTREEFCGRSAAIDGKGNLLL